MTTADQPAPRAISIASMVSVSVPIWLSLIRTELAAPSSMPRAMRSVFVTSRSSPTSWTATRAARRASCQPGQSSSARPSSIETIGYRATQSAHRLDHLVAVERPAFLGQDVARRRAVDAAPLLDQLGRGRVERDRDSARRAGSRPARWRAGSPRRRPRSSGAIGAKPPSSPWPVAWPSSCSIALSAGRSRHRPRSASLKVSTPTGMTMNSWKSRGVLGVLAAVEDVEHRHGQRPRPDAAEVAIQRQVVRRGRRVGARPATRPGWRSRRARPCSACRRARSAAVDADLVRRVEAEQFRADPLDDVTRPP